MPIALANPDRVARMAAADVFEPPPPVDFAAWASDNIVFGDNDPFPGRWNPELFPFFTEIFRALSPDDTCRIVTIRKSAQVGGTILATVFTCGSMVMDPCHLLFVHPTDDNGRRWSKMKLKPMLRNTAALARIFPERARDAVDSVMYKETEDGRGVIQISGANSPASLSQVTMRRQVQDDLSKWETNAAGDPETQADNRSRAHEFAKILKISTPLVSPGCRISRNFLAGSQEEFHVPCPHCGHRHTLGWENFVANIDPEAPEKSCFTCPECGCEIREHHRPAMLRAGEWRAANPKAKRQHRSFYIWSAYSLLQSFETIAREWLKAKGDPASEQTCLNDTAGIAYEADGEAESWEALRDRAAASDYPRGRVPAGALVLTLGMDCQVDRVEWQLVGWGREKRRFVVDCGVVPGHISEPRTRELLGGILDATWPSACCRARTLDLAAIDGNAWTEDVFEFVRRRPASQIIMVRGVGSETAPLLVKVKRETNRQGKKVKYGQRFFNFAASVLKMALYRNSRKTDPEATGYIAFPRGLEDEYFRQLCAEKRVEQRGRDGFPVWKWVKDPTQPNEMLDTMNQAEVAAIRFGIRAFQEAKWDALEAEREMPVDSPQLAKPVAAPTPAPPPAPAKKKRQTWF